MGVIVVDEEAFKEMFAKLAEELKQKLGAKPRDKWIDTQEAMDMLRIKSKTTLQRLRDEGKIRFTQPEPQTILYDSDSIGDYFEKHAKNKF